MDWGAFLQDWKRAAADQGFVTEALIEVGGDELLASSKGDLSKPTVYLSAGIHGDEPAGPGALLALLKEGFFDERFHWLVCPALNPSGLRAGVRENGGGVDLNRDYARCATAEVSAHAAWLQRQKVPSLFLSLHEDWESTGFYFYEISLGDREAVCAEILAVAEMFFLVEPCLVIDEHEVTKPGWIDHSAEPDFPEEWPEAIFLAKHGCPHSLTFETPSREGLDRRVACHQALVRAAVERTLL